MRMNAAETSASRAIADCTPLAVVSRSRTTAAIETFISDVSTTSTNIAMASSTASSPTRSGAAAVPAPLASSTINDLPFLAGPHIWTARAACDVVH
jgi:hypothetical protein